MVVVRPSRTLEITFMVIGLILLATAPALAQQGNVLTTLENQVSVAAKGW
ncbi:MAG: conjugal transfer protein TrbL, partial [Mesorhizobium sp.]